MTNIYYSDNFFISENQNGLVLEFYKDKTELSDVVRYGIGFGMSPLSAKEFLYALYNAIGEYEQKHGEIKFDPALLTKIKQSTQNPIGFTLN